jgi:SAM-dependent methyltransferase
VLARLYHAHHSRHLEDLPFWLELARRGQGPVLELGCGSGRVLLPLLQEIAGIQVVGLENDPAMLALLAGQEGQLSASERGRLRLVQGDMAAFELSERFALILLPCNTYSMLEAERRRATLACVRRHLLPGGLFAASLPNPALLLRLPRRADSELEDSFPHPMGGEPVQVSSGWERSAAHLTVYWHYDHLLPDGRVERISTQAVHELAPAEAYLSELEAAGLQLRELYGDFDRSPYKPDSPSLIFTGRVE